MRPRILFVDDEPEITEAMRVSLRSEPFEVFTANSAEEALAFLERQAVDVVVSDEQMPGVNGSALLTTIRAAFPDTSRIILTGNATVGATISAVNDARVFRVLRKPCPVPEIVSCLHQAIAARASNEDRLELESEAATEDLEAALETIHMVYQPIISIEDRRVYAYEALLRSGHDKLTTPPQIIEAAVALNRHADLDRQVFRLVAADAATLPPGTHLFVNLLPQSLGDRLLSDGIDDLAPYADRVALEITERAQLDSSSGVSEELAALRAKGFRIVLDDLGAGYAGLTSFAAMRPDVVKFDMELVRDIHRSETSSKLVASMIELCHELGISTVGEGVETREELEHLTDLGCDLLQGFGIARPAEPWVEVMADEVAGATI